MASGGTKRGAAGGRARGTLATGANLPIGIEAIEFGPLMAGLPQKWRLFAFEYVVHGRSVADAARQAGFGRENSNDLTLAQVGRRLVHDPRMAAAILELGSQCLGSLIGLAVDTLRRAMTDPTVRPADRIKAALGVSDRTLGLRTTIDVNHSHHHVVELDHTAAALESLRFLKSMDVPREKLIEQFGHSGLARYEKVIEMEDLQKMATAKLIEAREVA